MEVSSFQCFIGQAIHYKMYKTTSQWSCLHSSVSLDKQSNIKCIRQHHNGGVFIPALHWTRIPYKMYKTASQWRCLHSSVSLDKNPIYGQESHIKCIRQHHNGAVFIPVFHWTRIPYQMYKTTSQWSCLHSSVSLDKNLI
jgi:hypothetical protein